MASSRRSTSISAIAPERLIGASLIGASLIRASLIQILFSVRSERRAMDQVHDNRMFRWFVGLGIDDPVWGEGRPEICPVDRFQP
jgi:transposase